MIDPVPIGMEDPDALLIVPRTITSPEVGCIDLTCDGVYIASFGPATLTMT